MLTQTTFCNIGSKQNGSPWRLRELLVDFEAFTLQHIATQLHHSKVGAHLKEEVVHKPDLKKYREIR